MKSTQLFVAFFPLFAPAITATPVATTIIAPTPDATIIATPINAATVIATPASRAARGSLELRGVICTFLGSPGLGDGACNDICESEHGGKKGGRCISAL